MMHNGAREFVSLSVMVGVLFGCLGWSCAHDSKVPCPKPVAAQIELLMAYDVVRRGDKCYAITHHEFHSDSKDFYFYLCLDDRRNGEYSISDVDLLNVNIDKYRAYKSIPVDWTRDIVLDTIQSECNAVLAAVQSYAGVWHGYGKPEQRLVKLYGPGLGHYFICSSDIAPVVDSLDKAGRVASINHCSTLCVEVIEKLEE